MSTTCQQIVRGGHRYSDAQDLEGRGGGGGGITAPSRRNPFLTGVVMCLTMPSARACIIRYQSAAQAWEMLLFSFETGGNVFFLSLHLILILKVSQPLRPRNSMRAAQRKSVCQGGLGFHVAVCTSTACHTRKDARK